MSARSVQMLMHNVTLQELDVQNAAAAEQHVKDMADYDAKLTEAAAAWEAEKKKKKGKAKDEVAVHSFTFKCPRDALQQSQVLTTV